LGRGGKNNNTKHHLGAIKVVGVTNNFNAIIILVPLPPSKAKGHQQRSLSFFY